MQNHTDITYLSTLTLLIFLPFYLAADNCQPFGWWLWTNRPIIMSQSVHNYQPLIT